MPPQQYVTLIAEGGSPVTLANSRGNPYPTTGYGGLVFDHEPTLYYPTLVGAIYDSTAGFARGTVDAPPIFFLGDVETGIYSPTGGEVAITNNGVQSLRTNAAGDTILRNDLYVGAVVQTGIWRATAVEPAYGGTGLSSYTIGDLIYASGSATLAKLADIASGNVLLSGGVATAPAWGKVDLTQHVTGNLPVTNLDGGTGATSSTYWRGDGTWNVPVFSITVGSSPVAGSPTGRVLYNNGGTLGAYPITGTTNVVMSNGPSIQAPTITGALTYGGVALSAAVTGTQKMVLSNAPTITGALTYGGVTLAPNVTGTGKMVLDTAPTISNLALGTPLARTSGGTGATSISGGLDAEFSSTRGSILYRGAAGWAALGPSTAGLVLQSGGAGADPLWGAASAGNVVSSGTPTAGQLASWISASTIQGVTVGTGLSLAGTTLNASAINQSSVAPTIHVLSSGTTFSRPAGALWARVRAVGGGGGGGGSGASDGGPTVVNGVTALGGAAGTVTGTPATMLAGGAGGSGGTGTADIRIGGTAGGVSYTDIFANGGDGKLGTGGRGLPSGSGDAFNGNQGGGGGSTSAPSSTASGGGSGEYIEFIIPALPPSLSYSIGSGGSGGTSGGGNSGNGGDGVVILEVHYNY